MSCENSKCDKYQWRPENKYNMCEHNNIMISKEGCSKAEYHNKSKQEHVVETNDNN